MTDQPKKNPVVEMLIEYERLARAVGKVAIEFRRRREEEGLADQPKTETAPVAPTLEPAPARKRLSSSVTSEIAARRLEAYLQTNAISKTDFAIAAGTSDRTLRKFRATGQVRLDILQGIAEAMGTTPEKLLTA